MKSSLLLLRFCAVEASSQGNEICGRSEAAKIVTVG